MKARSLQNLFPGPPQEPLSPTISWMESGDTGVGGHETDIAVQTVCSKLYWQAVRIWTVLPQMGKVYIHLQREGRGLEKQLWLQPMTQQGWGRGSLPGA